jgi:hypothetical protein
MMQKPNFTVLSLPFVAIGTSSDGRAVDVRCRNSPSARNRLRLNFVLRDATAGLGQMILVGGPGPVADNLHHKWPNANDQLKAQP